MPPAVDLGHAVRLEPREAVAYFRRKGYALSWNWWEIWEAAHTRAFTVAKAMRLDVLSTLRTALDRALAEGRTRRQFAKEIEPELRRLGWWGRRVISPAKGPGEVVQLGSPRRLRTIFDTNMRTAHAAARQQAQAANAGSRPYWMYSSRQDSRVRPAHAALDGQVFRADDPIWKTHYPPNGWNCRCRVRALTESQVRARGLRVHDSRTDGELHQVQQRVGLDKWTGEEIERPGTAYSWTDATGKKHTLLPDPGWSYSPGQAALGPPPVAPAPKPAPAWPAKGRRRAGLRKRDEARRYKAAEDYLAALPLGPQNSLRGYTAGADRLNAAIRSDMPLPDGIKRDLRRIHKVIENAPPPPPLVYRGVSYRIGELEVGQTIQLDGLISTSLKPSVAAGFARRGGRPELLEVRARKGVYMKPMSVYRAEDEVLLRHGSRYRVVGIDEAHIARDGSDSPHLRKKYRIIQIEEL